MKEPTKEIFEKQVQKLTAAITNSNGLAPNMRPLTSEGAKEIYYNNLKKPKWQKKRLEVFSRDKWRCRMCDEDDSTLHVHHIKYPKNGLPWDIDSKYLITLCEDCHSFIENRKNNDEHIDCETVRLFKQTASNNSRIMSYAMGECLRIYFFNEKGELVFNCAFTKPTMQSLFKVTGFTVRNKQLPF